MITGPNSGIVATTRIDWVTPYTLSPTQPSTLFLGTYQMFRSTNGGTVWGPVGPADMTGGGTERISTVTVGRSNGNYVYAGTTDGAVWRSDDGGTSWRPLAGGLPSRRINDLDSVPADPERAFCVVSGFNTSHLFEFKDESWVARGAGLPNVPANAVLVLNATDVYVGTDVGVFVSNDGGQSFAPFNAGLPAGLVVTDLEYNATTGTITAGTYGRGAWQQTLCTALDPCHDAGVHDPATGLCTNPPKPDGSACDDGNPCTTADTCAAGQCLGGTATAAPRETAGLEIAADKTTLSWSAAANATRHAVVRGSTAALPVGSDSANEVCFENLADPALADPAEPSPDAGFWYLSRGENVCGPGTLGTLSDGSPRIATACP